MGRRIAALVLGCALLAQAQPPAWSAADTSSAARPKIGLVLGGGGARGAAHVGVLKVLEELRIPVDCIAGTSMGSIVGGLYASGMRPAEIEREMRSMDWNGLFKDELDRADRSFRRKRDDDLYVWKAKPGLGKEGLKIPPAAVHGQKFDLELNRLTQRVSLIKDFDQLSIPYRAVAADIVTGQPVVLSEGSLPLAIRASMAVPGAFDPVELNGHLLVDGGIADNVPVDVARQLCGEELIVVDVGSGLMKREDIQSGLDISAQLVNFLFTLNSEIQLKTLTPRDVLIKPELGDIGGGSFGRVGEAIPLGERSARAAIEQLRRFSLNEADYARHLAARKEAPASTPVIAFVRIENRSQVGDDVIAARLTVKAGEPLDVEKIEQDIGHLYGLDIFQSVRYEIVKENDQTGLVITAQEKSWGPGYLQPGLSYSNDLEGGGTFNVGATYTLTEINRLNGEWRTGVQFGDEPSFFTELYQPLDPASRHFIQTRVGYVTRNINLFDDQGHNLSRYQATGYALDLGVGREFGTWGQLTLGYRFQTGEAELVTGEPAPDYEFDNGELAVGLLVDKLDNLYFPRSGNLGYVTWIASREGLGADSDFDQARLQYTHALSLGKDTLIGTIHLDTTLDDDAPLESLFRAGGFLNLSGLEENQLSGQHFGMARLIYLHQISDILYFQSYAGASLEVGNVWQDRDDIAFDDTLTGGSLFLGLDTPIGPFYFGFGYADTGNSSLYVRLAPLLRAR